MDDADPPRSTSPGRAVVTGGAGFIGRAFIRRLSAEGWSVAGVDVRPAPDVTTGDITRAGGWVGLLDGADLVIHAAALIGDSGDARAHVDANIEGTRTVMASSAAAGVGRVVHLSSAVVVGPDVPEVVEESRPIRMTGNPYTDTKAAAEHVALTYAARGLPLTILRPAHVYGPHSSRWTIRVVELISRGLFALVDGGEGIMTPTYIDDLVDGGMAAATDPAAVGEVLHVTGGVGVTAAEFFGCYAEMLDRSLPSLPKAAAGAITAGAERVMRPLGLAPPLGARSLEHISATGTYSVAKAARLVGWAPRVTLEAGMAATETWLREVGLIARH